MKLIFDTETTGLARFDLSANSPEQPRLVQLGVILADDENNIIHECGLIIKPEGFTIPSQASNIHGITTEYAMKYGVPARIVVGLFNAFLQDEKLTLIAHNLKFDRIVMESELHKIGLTIDYCSEEFCTMLNTTSICKIPAKKANGYKWPKLSEAYKYFFNEELVDAHDALTDVRACFRIYKELTKTRNQVYEAQKSIHGYDVITQ